MMCSQKRWNNKIIFHVEIGIIYTRLHLKYVHRNANGGWADGTAASERGAYPNAKPKPTYTNNKLCTTIKATLIADAGSL